MWDHVLLIRTEIEFTENKKILRTSESAENKRRELFKTLKLWMEKHTAYAYEDWRVFVYLFSFHSLSLSVSHLCFRLVQSTADCWLLWIDGDNDDVCRWRNQNIQQVMRIRAGSIRRIEFTTNRVYTTMLGLLCVCSARVLITKIFAFIPSYHTHSVDNLHFSLAPDHFCSWPYRETLRLLLRPQRNAKQKNVRTKWQ